MDKVLFDSSVMFWIDAEYIIRHSPSQIGPRMAENSIEGDDDSAVAVTHGYTEHHTDTSFWYFDDTQGIPC